MKLFLFIFLSFSICSLNAELKFQQKTLNFTLDNENQFVDFEFKFKNEGKSPVLITNIQTSCGCTTSNICPRIIDSGEYGTIHGSVHLEPFEDFKFVKLTVKTDLIPQNSIILGINVERSKIVEIKPKLLFWQLDTLPIEKTFTVKISKHSDYKLKEILLISNRFRVKELNGNSYSIKPISTESKTNETIKVILRNDKKMQYTHIVHLVIK